MTYRRRVLFWMGAAALLGWAGTAGAVPPGAGGAPVPLNPTAIPQFVQELPLLYPTATNPSFIPYSAAPAPDLSICEFTTQILPAGSLGKGTLAPWTSVWGYELGATCPAPTAQVAHSYLGPVMIATRGTPTAMTYWNQLPAANQTAIKAYSWSTDQTLIWGDPMGLNIDPTKPIYSNISEENQCYEYVQANPGLIPPAACLNNYGFLTAPPATSIYAAPLPAAVHIHGGEVPAQLDGGPDSWWTGKSTAAGVKYGHGYYSLNGTTDLVEGKATYVYPNGQEAAPIWFHDHMLGATRLNVYAGIAGGYMVTEPDAGKTVFDQSAKLATGLLPLGLDTNGDKTTQPDELLVPLILQDRMFDTTGQLYFPAVGINPEHPYWVPEFVGDTIVVNGKAWPYMNVQPKRYRFLFLNGSNARTYALWLMNRVTGVKGPSMWVIGNDQGYLDAPQQINPNAKVNDKLVIMPGERYEVIVDFSTVAGQTLILTNNAPAPYPGGASVSASTTGRIVQFRVAAAAVADSSYNPALGGAIRVTPPSVPTDPPPAAPMVRLADTATAAPAAGVTVYKTRRLTLNEVIAKGGPVEILVNNTLYDGITTPVRSDFTLVTTMGKPTYYSELPIEGETELWEIVNLTADAHPMHPHLVAFQIVNRQALDLKGYTAAYNLAFPGGLYVPGAGPPQDYNCGNPTYATTPGVLAPATCTLGGNPDPAITMSLLGLPIPPAPQEIGWKDTVMVPPNMVTRILVRYAKTEYAASALASAIGYDFDPSGGHGYVWHCHIIDHEDNEMMRPFQVKANPAKSHPFTGF